MFAAIRVRGSTKIKKGAEDTLQMLRLERANHMVLLDENDSMNGMLKKVENYIAYGVISKETLERLLEKRTRLPGDKRISAEKLKEWKIKDFAELAKKAAEKPALLKELGIKPVFRLNPPRKGHKRAGIKKSFSEGGALGNRAEKINELILQMV